MATTAQDGRSLDQHAGEALAWACVDAAGLRGRVEVTYDPRAAAVAISGPDQFGMLGMTAYKTLRVSVPTSPRAIGLAAARHVLGEFWAHDDEIAARAAELPLALAVLVAPDGLPRGDGA